MCLMHDKATDQILRRRIDLRDANVAFAKSVSLNILLRLWPPSSGRLLAVALVEAIDASGGVDQLLLAGEERMAS